MLGLIRQTVLVTAHGLRVIWQRSGPRLVRLASICPEFRFIPGTFFFLFLVYGGAVWLGFGLRVSPPLPAQRLTVQGWRR